MNDQFINISNFAFYIRGADIYLSDILRHLLSLKCSFFLFFVFYQERHVIDPYNRIKFLSELSLLEVFRHAQRGRMAFQQETFCWKLSMEVYWLLP